MILLNRTFYIQTYLWTKLYIIESGPDLYFFLEHGAWAEQAMFPKNTNILIDSWSHKSWFSLNILMLVYRVDLPWPSRSFWT